MKTTKKQTKSVNKKISVEERYKKMTQHEHCLAEPDNYIGGTEEIIEKMAILSENELREDGETETRIIMKEIKYIPGLYKLFDEMVVNAFDHHVRDKTTRLIKVNIDQDSGEISCYNDGNNGVPVEIHKEVGVYVPEMIFGQLLTSGNYNNKEKRITGGKNGLGAKLINIFSSKFYIEVIDRERGLKYQQHFSDNMYTREDPKITQVKAKKSSILFRFTPDYKRFGIDGLSDDMYALLKKRVYDISANLHNRMKVYLNDTLIDIDSFEHYCKLFYSEDTLKDTLIYEEQDERDGEPNPRWRIGVVFDPHSGYRHFSFVNSICTFKGGRHVEDVTRKIVSVISDHISGMAKYKNITIKPAHIKDNITLFLSSTIEKPGFDGQTKETLTTSVTNFGSRYDPSTVFIKKLLKCGIIEEVTSFAQLKAMHELKSTDGKKVATVKGIDKLHDAKKAGTRNGKHCCLILTEGDSAAGFAFNGLEIIGDEYYGVYPLRGKMLNVRDATPQALKNNQEMKNLNKILGLQIGKSYNDLSKLRYGRVLVLTDQDPDGSHIKGLFMNFIHFFWPSLAKRDGFIQSLGTPIVKAFKKTDIKKKNAKVFYTLNDYRVWRDSVNNIGAWRTKYYKGLGSSTKKESMECFEDFDERVIKYIWEKTTEIEDDIEILSADSDEDDNEDNNNSDQNDNDSFDMTELDKSSASYNAITKAFAKKRADDRKIWLSKYDSSNILENTQTMVSYEEFIDKDLIHFSYYDTERSIPSLCDGLKPSQRKILYGALKRNMLNEEVKVVELTGYVTSETSYHHGDSSLNGAITNMAQIYVGSNNINLLWPEGNAGSRKKGGHDAAAPRYLAVRTCSITPYLFRSEDQVILKYNYDDGKQIEPSKYAPILPTVLINGAHGIGTGWSCDVWGHNVKDCIKNVKLMLDNKEPYEMEPWFRGFNGKVSCTGNGKYMVKGKYEWIDKNTIIIKEIPISKKNNIESYRKELEKLIIDEKKPTDKQILEYVGQNVSNDLISIELKFGPRKLSKLAQSGDLEKILGLQANISESNMVLFGPDGMIKRYNSTTRIFKDWFNFRYALYEQRKMLHLEKLKHDMLLLKYHIQFLKDDETDKIKLDRKTTEQQVYEQLEKLEYPRLGPSWDSDEEKKTYNYLTNVKLFDRTLEKRMKLEEDYKKKREEFEKYKNSTIKDIWLDEIAQLEKKLPQWERDVNDELFAGVNINNKNNKKRKTKRKR